jgi:hypothetical protein
MMALLIGTTADAKGVLYTFTGTIASRVLETTQAVDCCRQAIIAPGVWEVGQTFNLKLETGPYSDFNPVYDNGQAFGYKFRFEIDSPNFSSVFNDSYQVIPIISWTNGIDTDLGQSGSPLTGYSAYFRSIQGMSNIGIFGSTLPVALPNYEAYWTNWTLNTNGPNGGSMYFRFEGYNEYRGVELYIENVKTSFVPEPDMWAFMIVGFGLIGLVSRSSQKPMLTAE